MEDDVRTGNQVGDVFRVPDVAEAQIDGVTLFGAQVIKPPVGTVGVVHAKGAHVGTLGDQPLGDVASDEAVRARNNHGLARKVLLNQGDHWPFAVARSLGVPTSIQSDSIGHAATVLDCSMQA